MPHCRCLPQWSLVAALTTCLTAQAAEWVAEPSVNLRGEYDDNFRLTSAAHNDVWGTILDPRLTLSRRSELWKINAAGRIRAANYTGDDGLDTVDNFFDLNMKRQLERGSLQASASLANDTTLQNEELDIDTGITVNQIDRTQKNIEFTGQYMFTESTWLEASVALHKIEYDGGEQYGLLDYEYSTPGVQIIHQLNPKTQVFSILNHTTVKYENNSNLESITDSLQIGASYDITETWNVSGSIGNRRTRTSESVPTGTVRPGFEILFPYVYDLVDVPRDSESTGLVYDARLSRQLESGHLNLSASQEVTPSSTGTDTETTRIGIDGLHRFDAKLSGILAVSYYQSSTVGGVTTRADNDRYRISPSLSWNMDEDLVLNAGYAYTRIKRDAASDDNVDSNAVYIGLGYTWPRMAISR